MADPQVSEVLADPARVNGAAGEATLSGGELAWRPSGGGDGRRLELESEVLGCRVEGRKLKLATFFCGGDGERPPAMACGGGTGDGRTRRRRGEVVMEMESEDAAARWGDAVRDRLSSFETKHRFQEMSHSLDLRKYDGIICVSGDGVLVEVVNGLLQREDWETAIKVPLGIIPADFSRVTCETGTGNGMAQSLLHAAGESFSISNAVFAIIRGKSFSP
ncbi:hypothetical protein PR202_gb21255 [Eleusine coracana subsp. coracana]|uniref:DAGKc domain-containing protein n=1 Tax=Eleusine coracana subsp. coracana TaxID=191504 RepID=A0AAV5FCN4_ELECO|nr:hypothetical protein PR202_gb21255 [Eleusine coracana subsp. coracana]